MKRLVLSMLILVAALFVSSCSKDKDAQIESQATKITQLQDSLSVQANRLYEKDVKFIQNARDLGLAQDSVSTLNKQNQALSSQLKKANKQVAGLTSALAAKAATLDTVQVYVSQQASVNTNLINELAQCGEEKKAMQGNQNRYVEEIGLIAPWYYKWRHDAHRSFVNVMLGAGKAKEPGYPEPNVNP
jgi:chromosome segregation ATPase